MRRFTALGLIFFLTLGLSIFEVPHSWPPVWRQTAVHAQTGSQPWTTAPIQFGSTCSSTTCFFDLQGGMFSDTGTGNDSASYFIVPVTGTLTYIATAASTVTGGSYNVSIRLNGTDQAATCVITSTQCTSSTSVSVSSANSKISGHVTATSTPSTVSITVTCIWTPTVAGQFVYGGNTKGGNFLVNSYGALTGNGVANTTTEANAWVSVGYGGTVEDFCVSLGTTTGAGGSRVIYISQNANGASSTLNVTLTSVQGTAVTCSSGLGNLTAAKGDTLSVFDTFVTSPNASAAGWGLVITSASGAANMFSTSRGALPTNTGVKYYPCEGFDGSSAILPSSSTMQCVVQNNMEFLGMQVQLSAAPGAAASGLYYIFQNHLNGAVARNNFACEVFEIATSCYAPGQYFTAANDSWYTQVASGASPPATVSAAVTMIVTMTFSPPPVGCNPYAVMADFSGTQQGGSPITNGTAVTLPLLNLSDFGITGSQWVNQNAIGGTNTFAFASAAHHAIVNAASYPTLCTTPYPGDNGSTGLSVLFNTTTGPQDVQYNPSNGGITANVATLSWYFYTDYPTAGISANLDANGITGQNSAFVQPGIYSASGPGLFIGMEVPDAAFPMSALTRTSNVVTATIASANNWANVVGQSITVATCASIVFPCVATMTDTSFAGTFTLSSASGTTLTWSQTAANSSAVGGTVHDTNGSLLAHSGSLNGAPIQSATWYVAKVQWSGDPTGTYPIVRAIYDMNGNLMPGTIGSGIETWQSNITDFWTRMTLGNTAASGGTTGHSAYWDKLYVCYGSTTCGITNPANIANVPPVFGNVANPRKHRWFLFPEAGMSSSTRLLEMFTYLIDGYKPAS